MLVPCGLFPPIARARPAAGGVVGAGPSNVSRTGGGLGAGSGSELGVEPPLSGDAPPS
jgi:hypothetical protein